MKSRMRIFYLILCVSPILFFIEITFAGTQSIDNADLLQFSADKTTEDVKTAKPVNLSVEQDSLLGLITDAKFLFGINPANATAVELAAGPRVFRANGTYGYALNDKNRIKLTGEYLTENLDFNFYTGDTRQWVHQGAIGAAYQYWLGQDIIKSLQIGGHYSHAANKQLSDQTIALDNGITLLDQRRIAGGNDANGTAEGAMQLWSHSLLTLGIDYDQVHYDTEYVIHNTANKQGLGGHAFLQQLLTSSTQLSLQSGLSQLANNYGIGLNWIWASRKKTTWAAGINSSYTTDHTTERHFWVNGINLTLVWDTPQASNQIARYNDPAVAAQDLLTWSSTPAVRMPDVLAISDERIVSSGSDQHHFISQTAVCPAQIEFDTNTKTYSAPDGWVQSYPVGPAINSKRPVFESANLMSANAGLVQCEYVVAFQTVLLTNPAYSYVEATGTLWQNHSDGYWPPAAGVPMQTCGFGNTNTQCTFATVNPNDLIQVKQENNQSNTQPYKENKK